MTDKPKITSQPEAALPPDDLHRNLVRMTADGEDVPHIGVVGDTYTILLSGKDTAGRFCLIDMHVPPGGGPPPHRHDFEETFTVLEGELEATFRDSRVTVRAGETIHIPANAPHQFRNSSAASVRMLCICSPAGQEDFFEQVGIPLSSRTAHALFDEAAQKVFKEKAQELAPKYRTEILAPSRK